MPSLAENYRLTALKRTTKIPTGIDGLLLRLRGIPKRRKSILKKLLKDGADIVEQGKGLSGISQEALKDRLGEYRASFRSRKEVRDKDIRSALALITEAVHFTLGYRPYPVQIAGALALYKGYIAEMSTGEGKTVTAAMTAILRGFSGKPCHVITANDYLAARDAEIMAPLFHFCNVSVGSVTGTLKPDKRRAEYAKDVTYTTAKEVLADFLRDRIALGKEQNFSKRLIASLREDQAMLFSKVVQRGLHTAIVDEADNVLIDEAVTPLIISKEEQNEAFVASCTSALKIADRLKINEDYERDEKFRSITFLKDIESLIREHREEHPGPFSGIPFQKDLVREALVAKEFFHRDRQYVIEDKKIIIVDESTGRKMPMRSWSGGLHQLIEAKEGLPLSPVKETEARMSFQRFFRFYAAFSGMTGTGKEAAGEFWHIYGAPVITIPNNRKSRRKVSGLRVFADKENKFAAILREIQAIHATGRPVLIGTRSVAVSEDIAARLTQMNIHCNVINAVREKEEAEIIAGAGKQGAVTVATNMAGRGTDIKIPESVRKLGGLHVIATECHRSSRIDRQLFGRSARQGDPGSAVPYTSLDDDLLIRNLPKPALRFLKFLIRTMPGSAYIAGRLAVRLAQRLAERKDYQSRFSVQKTDSWLDESLSFAGEDVR